VTLFTLRFPIRPAAPCRRTRRFWRLSQP